MIKVILWGTCTEYDMFYKWFELETAKGNMEIEAIILNEEKLFCKIDGIEVIKIDEILVRPYDYLIDMNQQEHGTVMKILKLLNIPRAKVIPAKVFGLPFFDLKRWIKVKESKISIIANTCWGGLTYNSLGLEFNSPFINMSIPSKSYFMILENFRYYMEQPLHFIEESYEPTLKQNYPKVGLEDVILNFIHDTNFTSVSTSWNRRKDRLNYNNLLVAMSIRNQEELDRFLQLPFEHKIGFTEIPCNEEGIMSFSNFKENYYQKKYPEADGFVHFVNNLARAELCECKTYDILKLLSHEKDYIRALISE